ncbi:MAG TPA: lipopolysaccharide biosynthesis protein [bacterium]|nr:lipopolysaccharide biosynthesis protein [bacterium]
MSSEQGPPGGLFTRVVRGGFWVFAFSVTQEILALTRLVILARLLSPRDFGLGGIAVLVLSTIETLSQPNFDSALIQKKEDTAAYLDSAWGVGVLRGIAIFAIVCLVAPYGAAFFRTPGATTLIRLIGVSALARGLTSVGVIQFRKDLRFDRQFIWQFAGRLADFVVAVVAALVFRNALALVLAFVAADVAKLVSSYLLHPYRPRFAIDWAKARELFGFGKWLLGLGIIALLLSQGDNALVGRLVGTTLLGFYQLARRVSFVPASEIAYVISAVTFPAYSKIQDQRPKLKEAYLMVLEVTAVAALPLAGMILALAPDITSFFFGTKWLPAVPAMRVLAIWGALSAIAATAEPALMAVGLPRKLTKYQALQLASLAAVIYPATLRWSIAGTAVALGVAAIAPCYLALRKVVALTGSRPRTVAGVIALPAAAAAVAGAAAWSLRRYGATAAAGAGGAAGFAVALVVYAAVYTGLVWWLGRRFGHGIGRILREVISTLPVGRTRERA